MLASTARPISISGSRGSTLAQPRCAPAAVGTLVEVAAGEGLRERCWSR